MGYCMVLYDLLLSGLHFEDLLHTRHSQDSSLPFHRCGYQMAPWCSWCIPGTFSPRDRRGPTAHCCVRNEHRSPLWSQVSFPGRSLYGWWRIAHQFLPPEPDPWTPNFHQLPTSHCFRCQMLCKHPGGTAFAFCIQMHSMSGFHIHLVFMLFIGVSLQSFCIFFSWLPRSSTSPGAPERRLSSWASNPKKAVRSPLEVPGGPPQLHRQCFVETNAFWCRSKLMFFRFFTQPKKKQVLKLS